MTTPDNVISFAGFKPPEANYFKVPNMFWDIEDLTIHERFVLLYILRHTWGYQEFGIYKAITIDEFQNGRKTSDGKRMDKGCGVSRGAISQALTALASKGYILIETNTNDLARVKKSYMLNMAKDSVHQMNAEFTTRTQSSSSGNRTEKETKKETVEIKTPPTPIVAEQTEKPATELQGMKLAARQLKAYGDAAERVAKALLNLNEDPNKNVGKEPFKADDIAAFVSWWNAKYPNLTLPRNQESCVKWFNIWRDDLQLKILTHEPTRAALQPYVQPYADITPEQRAESISLMVKPDIKRPQRKPIKGLEYELEQPKPKVG
jgi:hypothetical protein